MPLFSRIARSIQGRMSKSVEDNPDGALAKYLWLWQSIGKRPGRSLIPRPIRFFFAASLDFFSLVGWYVRTGILRVGRSVGSKEAIMTFARANRIAALTIVAGGAIGGLLTFSPLVRWSPADDGAEQVTIEARAQESLEFKLVLPVTELESALSRIDGQIVEALGADSIRALGRDVEDPTRDTQDLLYLLFGSDIDQSFNLSPFASLLSSGDVEGAYLVPTEVVEVATLFLGLTEVQRALARDVSLHWGAGLVDVGQRTYRRLYVTEEDGFVAGEMLERATAQRDPQFNQAQVAFQLNRAGGRRFSDFTAAHIGDRIAIVFDDEIVSTSVVRARIGARGVIDMGDADMVEAGDLALALRAGALPARNQ